MNRFSKSFRRSLALAIVTLCVASVPAQAFRMIQNTATGRVTAGARVTCEATGGFTHWTDSDIVWFLNGNNQGSGKAGSVQSSLTSWTNVPNADHTLTYGGATKSGWATDGSNTVLWASGNGCFGSCLAITALVLQSGQEIIESDISFNNNVTWTTNGANFDTEAVMTHELGHSLGIHHTEVSSTPRPTMFANYFGSGGRSLHADDVAALQCAQAKYPFDTNEPPVANFIDSGRLEHTFDGRSSTDDNGIAAYQWTFPGGVQKAGAVVSHFFERYGNHVITLTVTDTDGVSASRTRNVFISEPTLTPQQGLWYNRERSGHGIGFHRNGAGNYVLIWFTYTANGTPVWYLSGTGPKTKSTWSQPLYRATWNGTSASLTSVGSVKLVLDDSRDSWFSWVLDGQAGGERFRHLHGGSGRSGLWYPPTESGWGLDVSESNNVMVGTVFFYEGSQARWVQGQSLASSNAFMPVKWFDGVGLCPSCNGGSSTPPSGQSAGHIWVQIANGLSTTGQVSTSILMPSGLQWTRTNVPIQILTQP